MAEMKDFTCRACGAQFDTRDRLDRHNRREHGAQGQEMYGDRGQKKGGQTLSQENEQLRPGPKRAGESSDSEDEEV